MTFTADANYWFAGNPDPKSFTSRGVEYFYVDEDFTQVNASVKWIPTNTGMKLIDNNFELVAGVNNIFDAAYASPNDTYPFTVGKGVTFYTNFKWKF